MTMRTLPAATSRLGVYVIVMNLPLPGPVYPSRFGAPPRTGDAAA
jgi:hypothetical protein